MRIAIPIVGGTLSPHFGHCEEFALFDVDTETNEIVGRNNVKAPQHEPGLLPRWLHEHGADVIIAGGMGTRARQLFEQKEIQVIIGVASNEPEVIVSDLINGQLQTGGNLCDH